MDFTKNGPGIVETTEQWTVPTLFLRWKKAMLSRDVPRMFRQPVRAEDLSPDRTDELPVAIVASDTKQAKQLVLSFIWRNYARCHFSKLAALFAIGPRYEKRTGCMRVQFPFPVGKAAFRGC